MGAPVAHSERSDRSSPLQKADAFRAYDVHLEEGVCNSDGV